MEDGGAQSYGGHQGSGRFGAAPMPQQQQRSRFTQLNGGVSSVGTMPEVFFSVYGGLFEDDKEHTEANFAEEKVRVYIYACLYVHCACMCVVWEVEGDRLLS
jgi:hypothetical protein